MPRFELYEHIEAPEPDRVRGTPVRTGATLLLILALVYCLIFGMLA